MKAIIDAVTTDKQGGFETESPYLKLLVKVQETLNNGAQLHPTTQIKYQMKENIDKAGGLYSKITQYMNQNNKNVHDFNNEKDFESLMNAMRTPIGGRKTRRRRNKKSRKTRRR